MMFGEEAQQEVTFGRRSGRNKAADEASTREAGGGDGFEEQEVMWEGRWQQQHAVGEHL